MNRCWNGMSASRGVDPNLRAFSRYSGVLQGCLGTPGRPHGPEGRPDGQVVDEPMLERNVRLKGSRSGLAGLLPIFRRPPRLAQDDAGAGSGPTFDFQGHILERDDLLVAGEGAA